MTDKGTPEGYAIERARRREQQATRNARLAREQHELTLDLRARRMLICDYCEMPVHGDMREHVDQVCPVARHQRYEGE